MRTSCLVCYHVCDDKWPRKLFHTMRDYGGHLQSPGFRVSVDRRGPGAVPEPTRQHYFSMTRTPVLFVSLGLAEGSGDRVITALGKPYTVTDAPCIVV